MQPKIQMEFFFRMIELNYPDLYPNLENYGCAGQGFLNASVNGNTCSAKIFFSIIEFLKLLFSF